MDRLLSKARVLITVKTYPLPSQKYDELVCTAGLLEGERWIRIYPVPYRELTSDERFKKWEWIELDLEKRTDDARVESFSPRRGIDEPISLVGRIEAKTKDAWDRKREHLLKDVHTSMAVLIRRAKTERISLGVVKPRKVFGVKVEVEPERWNEYDTQGLLDLVPRAERGRKPKPVRRLPYRFSFNFDTEDGVERTMMIEDWEIGVLYWKCLRENTEKEPRMEGEACELVKAKLMWMVTDRDLHLIVGTTKRHHFQAPNPFVIIGLFYPPRIETYGQTFLFP